MSTGILTKYSASAGSGKTFSLTSIYLSHLFRDKYSYRRILAVTFTNKATAEMKSRILEQLNILASGRGSDYLEGLIKSTGMEEQELRKKAGELLFAILHDFSSFSVCTIDTFFQRIIRAFARESGLHSGYNIEMDYDQILSEAVDRMSASAENDNDLKEWLTEFVKSRLNDDKSWNPREVILKLSHELFRERYKILSEQDKTKFEDKKFLLNYIEKLKAIRSRFEEKLRSAGAECERIFALYGLTDDMFFHKGQGVPGFVHALSAGGTKGPNSYVRAILTNPPRWSSKEPVPNLLEAIAGGLDKTIREAIEYYDSNIVFYNSASEIMSNIYSLGILSDIASNVRELVSEANSFLIGDAGDLLRSITAGDQAPFIYEKIGNRFEHYMIDEFQDTSRIQWDNFLPLLQESLARGKESLVVGDIKQSIYRFRNSDWRILGHLVGKQFPGESLRNVSLDTNYRSRPVIIRFNNTLFSLLPAIIDRLFEGNSNPLSFGDIYAEAIQKDPGKESGGYVRIEFVENDNDIDSKGGGETGRSWKEKVLARIPGVVEFFQDKGYQASDIGILVRNSREGTDILNTLINYSNSAGEEKRSRYNYNVVSDYSLSLANSPAVMLIISTLRLMNDPSDDISRAAVIRYFLFSTGKEEAGDLSVLNSNQLNKKHDILPEGFSQFLENATHLSLFERIENIIEFFHLGRYSWNTVYLNTLQDQVIQLSESGKNDLSSFLDWWEMTGRTRSVILPANQDAARIYTIHKSKGLEFKVVILPFISWNDDHDTHHNELIWVNTPEIEPFNELGAVPLKYRRDPQASVFMDSFMQEKYSAYLDNLNLLYVAMTRARDAIYGFSAEEPDMNMGISRLLKEAISSGNNPAGINGMSLADFFNPSARIFETGEVPVNKTVRSAALSLKAEEYKVCKRHDKLVLKFSGEDYFSISGNEKGSKVNYGKLMHRAFEFIDTIEDTRSAAECLVMEGLIPASEAEPMNNRLTGMISLPGVKSWFEKGNRILREADILLPSGNIKRPDRIILRGEKALVIDFKFGVPDNHHSTQVIQYMKLLGEMGYTDTEGYLWYVSSNEIIKV